MRALVASSFAFASLLVAPFALARDVPVETSDELVRAIGAAAAGDRIVLEDGTYPLSSSPSCRANGTAANPIVVVAKSPLGAKIEVTTLEGFKVSGAYWRFEGLDVVGKCGRDSDCEHAFHVVGAARGFVLRQNRIVDFNAQLKANAEKIGASWAAPDDLLVEGNELYDTRPRDTANPTTKLNIDTGDRVVVRANYIHDFAKGGGDRVSYGAFMKSGGKDGVFERNLVVCKKLHDDGGTRIGLSFGGGGTGAAFCAPAFDPQKPCDPEHTGGTLRNNVIASCSDVGIYLNKARDTKVLYNTLVATAGIDFRYASSTGVAVGNVVGGKIRGRDGGTFGGGENLLDFGGFDAMFVAPGEGNFAKKGDVSALVGKGTARPDVTDDYCARARVGALDLGAHQVSLGDCATVPPVPTPGSPGPGASPGGPGATPAPTGSVPPGATPGSSEADGGCAQGAGAGGGGGGLVVVGAVVALVGRRRVRRIGPG